MTVAGTIPQRVLPGTGAYLAARARGGTTYPSSPPKVGDGRDAGPRRGIPWLDPASGTVVGAGPAG